MNHLYQLVLQTKHLINKLVHHKPQYITLALHRLVPLTNHQLDEPVNMNDLIEPLMSKNIIKYNPDIYYYVLQQLKIHYNIGDADHVIRELDSLYDWYQNQYPRYASMVKHIQRNTLRKTIMNRNDAMYKLTIGEKGMITIDALTYNELLNYLRELSTATYETSSQLVLKQALPILTAKTKYKQFNETEYRYAVAKEAEHMNINLTDAWHVYMDMIRMHPIDKIRMQDFQTYYEHKNEVPNHLLIWYKHEPVTYNIITNQDMMALLSTIKATR